MASDDVITQFNIGAMGAPGGVIDPCWPGNSRNSVAVPNTRGVVSAMRWDLEPGDLYEVHTWVYMIDLTNGSDPTILLEHKFDPAPAASLNQYPHDLAICPDGQLAVVTTDGGVGLYSLGATPAYVAGFLDVVDQRRWSQSQELWNSLEMSNTQAVVLSNKSVSSSLRWRVRVFNIGTGGMTADPLIEPDSSWGAGAAWDVALSDDDLVATVKTASHDVALLDVPGVGVSPTFIAGPGSSQYSTASGLPPRNDGTAILTPTVVDPYTTRRWAAFAGSNAAAGQARVHFYDLNSSWPGGAAVERVLNDPSQLLAASDLDLTPDGVQVMLRLSARDQDSGTGGGADWSRFAGEPPAEVLPSVGALGIYAGADSLRNRRGKSVSISRDPNYNVGWIHIVTVL